MKSKETIYRNAHRDAPFKATSPDKYDLLAMDEYAQSLAKEVVEKLEAQDPMLSRSATVALIKQKFGI